MGIAQCRKTTYLCTRKQKTTKKIIQELNFRRVVQVRAESPKLLAQGIALGILAIDKAPCKGKSFMYCQEL